MCTPLRSGSLSSSTGSPHLRPPWHSEEFKGEVGIWNIMYKCYMSHSCDPMVLQEEKEKARPGIEPGTTLHAGRSATELPSRLLEESSTPTGLHFL